MGSFAIAGEAVGGCFVSNEFLCYSVATGVAVPEYVWLYFSQPATWLKALGLSTGSTPTSRNRLKEEQFMSMTVRLPPVPRQEEIVSRVRRVENLARQATLLLDENNNEVAAYRCCGGARDLVSVGDCRRSCAEEGY